MRKARCGLLNIDGEQMNQEEPTGGVALMSIKPQFVEEIVKGTKTFEFRKAVFKRPVSKVVVYASLPVGKVIGEFTVKEIHQGTPNAIWKATRLGSGITESYFNEYFEGKENAFAIEIESFTPYKEGIPLKEFAPQLKAPPQSYCYLS